MRIKRILTNNAIIVSNPNGNDQIVCGKGIAYKKHSGDEVDQSLINQTFVLMPDTALSNQLEQLLRDIPLEYVSLSNDIVHMAEVSMQTRLNESLVISLADHIYETVRRYREGISISNGLIWEIRRFYEKEYEIALIARDMIARKFYADLPEDEAGYIAMHIVNAETENSTIEETMRITRLIQDIIRIVRLFFGVEFDEESGYYYRFITHLKFFLRRVLHGEEKASECSSDLARIIFEKYASACACAGKIEQFIRRKCGYQISDEEKMYITIHIHSVISKASRKEGEQEEPAFES